MLNTKMAIGEKPKQSIVLFKVLPGQTSIILSDKSRDILDISQELKEEWTNIYAFYKDIIAGQEKEINCDKAIDFFLKIINVLMKDYSLGDLIINEDLFKLYIFAFKKTCSSILYFIQNESEKDLFGLVKSLSVLTDFLLFSLQNRKKQICNLKNLNNLLQFILEDTNKLHETLMNKQNSQSSIILYNFIQVGMIIVGSSECPDTDAIEGTKIKYIAFNILISCLKSCFSSKQIQDVYFAEQKISSEIWEKPKDTHINRLVQFMKKKISVINSDSNTNPSYNLFYVVLYYLTKIVKIIKESDEWKKDIIEVIGNVIKANLHSENMKVETSLNINTICIKLLNLLIQNTDDPQGLIKGFISEILINEMVQYQIMFSIKNQLALMPVINSKNANKAINDISYTTTHDYISYVFIFLNAHKKYMKNISQGALASIISFFEDVFAELLMRLDEFEGKESDLPILKLYIVEYLKKSSSKQLPGQIMQLLESKLFHLTSPSSLEFKSSLLTIEEELDLLANERLICLLNESITKSWATKILHALMSKITDSLNNELTLFALYKLLYCAFTNEVYENSKFFNNILSKMPPALEYEKFSEIEKKPENKLIVAFVEIKGTQTLFQLLLSHYEMLSSSQNNSNSEKGNIMKEISVKITENFILHLHNFPTFCEELLKNTKTVLALLEYYRLSFNHQEICLNLLQKLLASIKYSKKLGFATLERNTYLPFLIFRFIQHQSSQSNEKAKPMIPFIELLVNFITFEENCPPLIEHQKTLLSTFTISSLFATLQDNK